MAPSRAALLWTAELADLQEVDRQACAAQQRRHRPSSTWRRHRGCTCVMRRFSNAPVSAESDAWSEKEDPGCYRLLDRLGGSPGLRSCPSAAGRLSHAVPLRTSPAPRLARPGLRAGLDAG